MPLVINGVTHADGDPLLIGGVQAQNVEVIKDGAPPVEVWRNTSRPSEPLNFAASEGELNQITFTWDAPLNIGVPVASFVVRNSLFQEIIAAPAGATSVVFTDAGSLSDTFHAIAINDIGESGTSNQDAGSSFAGVSPLIITVNGSYTSGINFPANTDITLCMCGGGGGGGADDNDADIGGGLAGAATTIVATIPFNEIVAATIGGGGSGGKNGAIGNAGGTTSFGSYLTAAGGAGGSSNEDGPHQGRGAAVTTCGGTGYDGNQLPDSNGGGGGQSSGFGNGANGASYSQTLVGGIGSGGGGASYADDNDGFGGRGQINISW